MSQVFLTVHEIRHLRETSRRDTLFTSTLGVCAGSSKELRLFYHAVDLESGAKVLPIGQVGGEDTPVSGSIYLLKSGTKTIPFIPLKERVLCHEDLANFAVPTFSSRPRSGIFPVTMTPVYGVGIDLRAFRSQMGPRSYYSYSASHFANPEIHGHRFESEEEYQAALASILEAIQVMQFDAYLTQPLPSLCIALQEASTREAPAYNHEMIIAAVNKLTSTCMSVANFQAFLKQAAEGPPLALEQLAARILAVERGMFREGMGAYPTQFFIYPELITQLRRSYQAYYTQACVNFETFLIGFMGHLQGRRWCRIIFEKYHHAP